MIQVLDDLTLSGTAGDADSGVAVGSVKATLADHAGVLVEGVGATTLQAAGTWQTTVSFDPSPYGVYTANASAGDEAMNTASATTDFRLDGLPPYADVTDGENFISPGQSKTITGVASDVPYPANGRTLHLHFETGAGVWEDGAGNDFTMQCSGAACPATGVSGKRGTAVAFDGGDDDLLDFTSSEIYTATTTDGPPRAAGRQLHRHGVGPGRGLERRPCYSGQQSHKPERRLLPGHPQRQPHPRLWRR